MSITTQPTAAPPQKVAADGPSHTFYFLICFYLLAVASGMRPLLGKSAALLDLVMPVALSLSLGLWAVVDAKHRKHPIPLLARPWVFLLSVFLVPLYVVWSRGWSGLGWLLLHAFLWLVVSAIALIVIGLLVHGPAFLDAL